MDQKQREQFRDKVIAAMEDKSWTATMTARAAGITTTTMTKVTNAEDVRRSTVAKLREVLGINGLAAAQASEGYPTDIELARDALGMILLKIPPEKRAAKVAAVFAVVFEQGEM